jgi:hypothetical protein
MKDVVYDKTGKIVYFSPAKFREQVIEQECCFICGRSKRETQFNNEHIVSKWILDEFNMHEQRIELPNGTTHKYGTYSVPCCSECNSRMGIEIEKPVSDLIRGGYKAVQKFLAEGGDPTLFYCWLARIFLKTHLKDLTLRKHLDSRQGTGNIGDDYIWEGLYLPFCLSRAFYADTASVENIMGSFIVVPIADNKNDLKNRCASIDHTNSLTMTLHIRDMGFIASFSDFGISLGNMKEMFKKINNRPINPSQFGQLAGTVAMASVIYKNRPNVFYSFEANSFISIPPENTGFKEASDAEWGDLLFHFTQRLLMEEDLVEGVKAGTRQFLWDKNNDFITTHLK